VPVYKTKQFPCQNLLKTSLKTSAELSFLGACSYPCQGIVIRVFGGKVRTPGWATQRPSSAGLLSPVACR